MYQYSLDTHNYVINGVSLPLEHSVYLNKLIHVYEVELKEEGDSTKSRICTLIAIHFQTLDDDINIRKYYELAIKEVKDFNAETYIDFNVVLYNFMLLITFKLLLIQITIYV